MKHWTPHSDHDQPGKWASLGLTIAVHLGLIAFLVFGVRWQSAPPAAMQVDLVAAVPSRPAPPPPPAPEPQKPAPKPEPPKPEPPKAPQSKPEPPKPEPKPQVKPDIATKAPEPKKPEPKKPEPKPEPEPKKPEPKPETKKPEPKKPEPKKPEPEKPREVVPPKDDYITERLAQETQRTQLERMMRDDAARVAAARSAGAKDAYTNAIRTKVRGNLLRPPGLSGNPEAVFDVDQLPSGEVLAIRLKRSSGVPALDDAIERAIRRSSPLPLPEQKELFERTLELRFRPLDEG
ncbi:MAG: energy transducer TonB [Aromatoleum sp.]|uniref:energy transducer TonB n=1 Tax=Aromatoleum sp. TaxID=2307007 RepID=UPI0028943C79|nr:energy transducer TonB [Aromatoleum sp.]MDT3672335.1 energy transducer TonB [Aromatoleum sp.]